METLLRYFVFSLNFFKIQTIPSADPQKQIHDVEVSNLKFKINSLGVNLSIELQDRTYNNILLYGILKGTIKALTRANTR